MTKQTDCTTSTTPSSSKEDCLKYFIEDRYRKLNELVVVYNPNCGCPIDQFFLLDRYPMSPKIHSICPECKNWCLMEISDPIIFHLPLTKQDFTLDDLKNVVVKPCRQEYVIKRYQGLFPGVLDDR